MSSKLQIFAKKIVESIKLCFSFTFSSNLLNACSVLQGVLSFNSAISTIVLLLVALVSLIMGVNLLHREIIVILGMNCVHKCAEKASHNSRGGKVVTVVLEEEPARKVVVRHYSILFKL